jgi:hypothetical protein
MPPEGAAGLKKKMESCREAGIESGLPGYFIEGVGYTKSFKMPISIGGG